MYVFQARESELQHRCLNTEGTNYVVSTGNMVGSLPQMTVLHGLACLSCDNEPIIHEHSF